MGQGVGGLGHKSFVSQQASLDLVTRRPSIPREWSRGVRRFKVRELEALNQHSGTLTTLFWPQEQPGPKGFTGRESRLRLVSEELQSHTEDRRSSKEGWSLGPMLTVHHI